MKTVRLIVATAAMTAAMLTWPAAHAYSYSPQYQYQCWGYQWGYDHCWTHNANDYWFNNEWPWWGTHYNWPIHWYYDDPDKHTQVGEPGPVILLGMALLGLAMAGRIRKS